MSTTPQSSRPRYGPGLRRARSLTTRLALLSASIVIVALVLVGVAWLSLTRQAVQSQVQQRHEELAHRVAVQLSNMLGDDPQVYFTGIWGILRAVEVGDEGVIYLVDDQGRMLGYAGFEGLQGQDVSQLPIVAAFLQRTPQDGEFIGVTGEPAIGAWYALDNGWGVVVETPARRALAQMNDLVLILIVSLIASAVGATLLSIGFARRITRPLDDLRQGAIAIGQGDLDHVIQVRTGDEIEDLAHQFNQMAQELKSSQAEIRVHAQELEQRVADRTHDLERRATLLATAADMGRVAASILDPVQLTRQVVDLVGERFDLYYVGLFLVAAGPDGEYAVLDAGTGEPGRLMKEQGHRLLVGGTSMVGMACATGQARIALDVGQERVRFDNPHLPLTRSEIALPLIVGEHILGALDAQSTRPGAFSQEDIAVLQLVADQVAVAVENARIFSHEAGVLEATSPIYRASRRLTTALTTDEVSTAIIDSVAETGADGCVIVEFEFTSAGEPEALLYRGVWRRDRAPQFKPGLRLPISASPFPLDMVETFWTVADTEQDETLPESARQVFENTDARALVNIPLRAAGRTFGQVVVLRNTPGTFPDTDLRLYETLSGQASVALERARLLEETRRRADEETALRTISDRIAQAIDIDAVLYSAVEGLTQALHATGAYMDLGAVPAAEGLSREEP